MEHALRIPELAEEILSQADNPSLAALAQAGSALQKAALDALWRHQEGFMNLLQCMPVWKVVHGSFFGKSMVSTNSDFAG